MALIAALPLGAAAEESPVAGYWDGNINVPGSALGVRVHLMQGGDGAWSGTIDIPMQGAKGIGLSGIAVDGNSVTFAIAGVAGDPTFTGTLEGDTISGTFSQNAMSFPFTLTRGGAEAPKRPQDPTPPFPYQSEDVTYTNGDVTLAGTLTIPEGDGPFPAVVLLSGSGPQNRDEEVFDHRPFLVIADYLTRGGIAVLRSDDRGVGESTGNLMQSTSADFAQDALAAVELLRKDPRIAPDRVGLLGHSEGALVAPLAASESKDVAFIVLLAAPGVPAPDLLALQVERLARAEGDSEENIAKQVEINRALTAAISSDGDRNEARKKVGALILQQNQLMPPESQPTPDALEKMIQANTDQLFTPWFQYFIRYDPRPALRKVTVPVLALNGALDLQVVDTQNLPAVEEALAVAGNKDVTARSLPGLNHMFQHATTGAVSEYSEIDETISPDVLELIYQWIDDRFGKKKG